MHLGNRRFPMVQGLKLTSFIALFFLLTSCAIQPIKTDEPVINHIDQIQKVEEHSGLTLEAEEKSLTVDLDTIESEVEQNAIEADVIQTELAAVNTHVPETHKKFKRTPFLTYNENSKRVSAWIKYFTKDDKKRFQRFINRGTPYKRDIESILHSNDLPIDLYYVGLIESGYNLKARSRAAAVGPWQFVRSAAKDYGLKRTSLMDERYDLFKATKAAALYFKDLYNIFGSWELALSAYNAGPSRIIYMIRKENTRDFAKLSHSRRFPKETANYIPKVVAVMKILDNPRKYGFIIPRTPSRFANTKKMRLRYSQSLSYLAKQLNLSVNQIKRLNPELLGNRTPFIKKGPYYLRIPASTYQSKAKTIASLYNHRGTRPYAGNSTSLAGHTHKVRRGENLSIIAKKYGISLRTLKRLNNLHKSHIYAGQKLKVRNTRSSRRSVASKKIHKVRRGENLSVIAKKYGMSVRGIKRLNNLKSSAVWTGQKLKVQSNSKNVYIVKRGDNLNRIASRFGKSIKRLMAKNSLKSSKIFPGQKLVIR